MRNELKSCNRTPGFFDFMNAQIDKDEVKLMSDYRKRLSENAEDFDSIINDLITDYEALKEYIDSGDSDNELVIVLKGKIELLEKRLKLLTD